MVPRVDDVTQVPIKRLENSPSIRLAAVVHSIPADCRQATIAAARRRWSYDTGRGRVWARRGRKRRCWRAVWVAPVSDQLQNLGFDRRLQLDCLGRERQPIFCVTGRNGHKMSRGVLHTLHTSDHTR